MATGIGDTLRDARQQRGLSLEDAAAETRIRATHLAALEQEEYTRLGGDVYVRGFIRSYAKLLGLDPDPLLQAHGRSAAASPRAAEPRPPGADPLERRPRRGVGVAVAAVALVAIVGLSVLSGDDPEQTELDDAGVAPEATEPEATGPADPEGGDRVQPAPTSTPAEPDAGDTASDGDDRTAEPVTGLAVRVEITERRAWVRALVDGDEVFQGTLEAGASETYEGDEEVRLRIGDPSAVELTVNGESVGNPGEPGQPVWVTVDADGDLVVG